MTTVEKYVNRYLTDELFQIRNTNRNLELSQINEFQKAIIFKYTRDGYELVNELLRSSKGKKNTEFGEFLSQALSKLPNYKGIVYRKDYLTSSELAKYKRASKRNESIVEYPFVSTTKFKPISEIIPGNTLFIVSSKRGKEIENIVNFGKYNIINEEYVLFNFNSSFSVLEVTRQRNYTLIIMDEV